MIDLWKSRRKSYLNCYYWERDENDDYTERSEIVYKKEYSGFFTAEEMNSLTISSQVIGETFMLPEESLTILTNDRIDGLKENDIVKIDGREKCYRVENIQRAPDKKQRFFTKNGYSASHYISLRG